MTDKFDKMRALTDADVKALEVAEKSYGDSWKKRGGRGAFMMLARKWDRIENQSAKVGYDIFTAILNDSSSSGILDDIQDLRRYLLLVEEHMTAEPETYETNIDEEYAV